MHYYDILMRECFALALEAEGRASPNPLVGCVVVKDGMIVGRGYHCGPGARHAEPLAIEEAGEKARGATLVVNLEPCNHHGLMPPCAPQIVKAGIRRVVAAYVDPDPRVLGIGIAYLREHGVDVMVGVLEEEARWLNRSFNRHAAEKMPWVTLKAALSLDGHIALHNGLSKWLSSEESRAEVHRLRFLSDAVLVGRGTVEADNPLLTVRHPDLEWKTPLKVVLDGRMKLAPTCNVFSTPPSLLVTAAHSEEEKKADFKARRVEILEYAESSDPEVPLEWVLRELGNRGIARLLVEGGQHVFTEFLSQDLVDEAVFYLTPRILGGDATPLVGNLNLGKLEEANRLTLRSVTQVGTDIKVEAAFVHRDH